MSYARYVTSPPATSCTFGFTQGSNQRTVTDLHSKERSKRVVANDGRVPEPSGSSHRPRRVHCSPSTLEKTLPDHDSRCRAERDSATRPPGVPHGYGRDHGALAPRELCGGCAARRGGHQVLLRDVVCDRSGYPGA